MSSNSTSNPFDRPSLSFREVLFIVLALVPATVLWGITQQRVSTQDETLRELKDLLKDQNQQIIKIDSKVERQSVDMSYIRAKLNLITQ